MRITMKEFACLTFALCALADVSVSASVADDIPRAYTSGHDVQLEKDANDSFQVFFSAPVPLDMTLTFHLSDSSVLEAIPDLHLTQGDNATAKVALVPRARGHCTVSANSTLGTGQFSTDDVYVRVNVLQNFNLNTFSAVVGWTYFVAWTVSFYPQVYTNWRRKSVIGLNFDFLALNLMGFTFYSVFNCGLYFSQSIQDMYFEDHPYGLIPVAVNDIVFALHAVFACIVTVLQTLIYERADQRVSLVTRGLMVIFVLIIIITAIIAATGVVNWLWFLYIFSYVKLAITMIKYVPQAYLNYRRKSTEGWAIGNVLLDFTGGSLSITQMFIDAFNYNDWSSIFGNPTKFGLGLFSVLFDCLFICQHYCLYRSRPGGDFDLPVSSTASNPEALKSESEAYRKF